jgi:GGDEF domain-containing protein
VFLNECRDIDIIGRFTESTFMALMPGTGPAGATVVARRMLEGVRDRRESNPWVGTPHAGLVTVPSAEIGDCRAFLARAESCLQLAREGRGEDGFCASSK